MALTRVRRAADRAADRFVRRGPRRVLWTQPTASLGNFLYEWMHAWTYQRRGLDIRCLVTERMEPWLPVFGASCDLVVRRSQVRATDLRERGLHADFGDSFDRRDLDAFLLGFVEESGVVDPSRVPTGQRLTARDLLINVRRGDYADPANWARYGFDLDAYLVAAVAASRRTGGPIERIHVVSDGIDWCRGHLAWLAGECDRLTFEDDGLAPDVHLALLAAAPRLVLANSTFSYWGGYLSTRRTGRPEHVVAPWFHVREGGEPLGAWHLDPRWTVVGDLPGGWEVAPAT